MKYSFMMVFCLAALYATCQTLSIPAPPSGLKYKLNYTVEESVFNKAPLGIPFSALSPLDKETMREKKDCKGG